MNYKIILYVSFYLNIIATLLLGEVIYNHITWITNLTIISLFIFFILFWANLILSVISALRINNLYIKEKIDKNK